MHVDMIDVLISNTQAGRHVLGSRSMLHNPFRERPQVRPLRNLSHMSANVYSEMVNTIRDSTCNESIRSIRSDIDGCLYRRYRPEQIMRHTATEKRPRALLAITEILKPTNVEAR
jgi:hypothetical protein